MVFSRSKRLKPQLRDQIVEIVMHEFGVSAAEIWADGKATSRHAWATLARHVCYYLAHTELGFSLSAIAEAFSRDRTSVKHGVNRVEDMRDTPIFELIAAQLGRRVGNLT